MYRLSLLFERVRLKKRSKKPIPPTYRHRTRTGYHQLRRKTAASGPSESTALDSSASLPLAPSPVPIERPDEHDLFQLWEREISRRRDMPHQLLDFPVRRTIDVGLSVLSLFLSRFFLSVSELFTTPPSTLFSTLPQLLTHQSSFLTLLRTSHFAPRQLDQLRGCLRPLDQVVGSEGSEAASPPISPSSAGAGWPALPQRMNGFCDPNSLAVSSAG